MVPARSECNAAALDPRVVDEVLRLLDDDDCY